MYNIFITANFNHSAVGTVYSSAEKRAQGNHHTSVPCYFLVEFHNLPFHVVQSIAKFIVLTTHLLTVVNKLITCLFELVDIVLLVCKCLLIYILY